MSQGALHEIFETRFRHAVALHNTIQCVAAVPVRLVEEGCLVASMPSAACSAELSTWMVLGRARAPPALPRRRAAPDVGVGAGVVVPPRKLSRNSVLSSTLPWKRSAQIVITVIYFV